MKALLFLSLCLLAASGCEAPATSAAASRSAHATTRAAGDPASNVLPFFLQTAIQPPDTLTTNAPVRALYQDRKGFFWVATDGDGVFRFDGKKLDAYGTGSGLPSDYVSQIGEDARGRIYFGTRAGVAYYENHVFGSLAPESQLPLLSQNFEFQAAALWFGASGGVSGYDGNGLHYFALPPSDRYCPSAPGTKGSSDETFTVLCTLLDKSGALWMGTRGKGLCRFDGKNYRWLRSEGLEEGPVLSLLEDANGAIWVGTRDKGILRVVNGHISAFPVTRCRASMTAPVQALVRDRSGQVWIGTADGLWRYDGKQIERMDKGGLRSTDIRSLYLDPLGSIWIGTDKGGVYICGRNGLQQFRLRGC